MSPISKSILIQGFQHKMLSILVILLSHGDHIIILIRTTWIYIGLLCTDDRLSADYANTNKQDHAGVWPGVVVATFSV